MALLHQQPELLNVCFHFSHHSTPKKIFIQHGLTVQDLQAAVYPHNTEIEFHEPSGWCIVPLSSPPDPLDECQADLENENNPIEGSRQLVRTHLLVSVTFQTRSLSVFF